jgi:hypothetical protein
MPLEPDHDLELPAILIGRRCEEDDLSRVDEAPWLAAFVHQCGGYSCRQEPVLGILLPLAWNVASDDAALEALRGLGGLAADSASSARAHRLPAELEGLHLTFGQSYHRGQLDALEDFLAPAFRLPRPTRGVEAFVGLADCDPISLFGGWRALSTGAARDRFGDQRTGDWPADVAAARARWDGKTVLDRTRLEALAMRFEDAGIDPALKVFLLWNNSD